MSTEQPDNAMRYIYIAQWHEGMQGQDGFYCLTLNCGHVMYCTPKALRCAMLCHDCRDKLQKAC